MLTDEELKKLCKKRAATPNVLGPEVPPWSDGKKTLAVAAESLRAIAQNCIEQIHEHRHLKTARILLLVEASEAAAKKLDQGERIVAGKAGKATPRDKLLSGQGQKERADFVVKLSGTYLERVAEEHPDQTDRMTAALIDHELLHCGAKIAGKFVDPEELELFVQNRGDDWLETCRDVEDEEGKILVRFYARDKEGSFVWKMRRHDVEEFEGVAARHGAWDRHLGRLIDELEKDEGKTLFDKQSA